LSAKAQKVRQSLDVNNLVRFVQDEFKKTFHVNCAQLTKTADEKNCDILPGDSVGHADLSVAKHVVFIKD
jgi:hypothetical protein